MKTTIYVGILIILSSCATAYHPITPAKIKHNMHDSKENLSLSYKYDVIGENGNAKYVKRAKKKGYQIVAYKVTNNSKDTLVMGKDIVFQNNNQQILLSNELLATKSVKQYGIGFLPYAAGSFYWIFLGGSTYQTKDSKYFLKGNYYDSKFPLGAVVCLPIMIGNMIAANFANRSFYDNLKYYDMNGKSILPNESIDGILVFKSKEQVLLQLGNKKSKF